MAAGDGLISMTPSSIAHSGTSASINADGGVDFTAVTELSLNGVFTSDYDNYLIVIRSTGTNGNTAFNYRLRSSGSDDSTTNYVYQFLGADGSSASGFRQTSSDAARIGTITNVSVEGFTMAIYGPALAQPTASRSTTINSRDSARLIDIASTHSVSSSYDGITVYPAADDITGNIHVFGYEE